MLSIHSFVFNDFGVNTYLVWDQNGRCLIIDAACYSYAEKKLLEDFISNNNLRPTLLINTHGHIDHILGNSFVANLYGLKLHAHRDGLLFYDQAPSYGAVFGFDPGDECKPSLFVEDGQMLECGEMKMEVMLIPGHAAGSICLYFKEDSLVFTGDVLFHGSIGRSDLPTGDGDLLIRGIKNRLLPLPKETKVFPGHGDSTTIGEELEFNPFLT